jgi:small subunit ribosomal protein S17
MSEEEKTEQDASAGAEVPADEVEPTPEDLPEGEAAAEDASPEPVAEAEPVAAEEAEPSSADEDREPAAPEEPSEATEPTSSAKPKKKRLPRALRPRRSKPKREKSQERKPIVRLQKPEHARGRRQERQGTVVSSSPDKTIVVRVDVVKVHPRYKKVIRRSTKLHAHDEANEAKVGDLVRIVETRPVSRLKRWRLQEIVRAAK